MNGPSLQVRPRRDSDLPGCVRVLAQVHRSARYPSVWPQDAADWLTPSDLGAALVAAHDTAIVGHVAVRVGSVDHVIARQIDVPSNKLATLSRLFISPESQRRGVAGQLLSAAMLWAQDHQLRLTLDVVDARGSAAALYEKHGWNLVGYRTAPWRTPDGESLRLRLYLAPV